MSDHNHPARILIVDDHPITRLGYIHLISLSPELEVCACADSPRQTRELAAATNPHLAILDISLSEGNGLELTRELQQSHQHLRMLVASAHDENLYAERALEAGALGYLCKVEATEKLLEAIHAVLAGDVYGSEQLKRRLLRRRIR